jgi:hypothetical protein
MLRVAEAIRRDGEGWGTLAELGRRFAVHRGTITRDVARLREADFETWGTHELADRIHKAEQRLYRFYDEEADRSQRRAGSERYFDPRPPRSAKQYQAPRPPVENPLERRKLDGINYVAEHADSLVARLTNVPEGHKSEPTETDLQVARLLGVSPPQSAAGAPSADGPKGVDGWEEFCRRRAERKGLTAFEDDLSPPDEW